MSNTSSPPECFLIHNSKYGKVKNHIYHKVKAMLHYHFDCKRNSCLPYLESNLEIGQTLFEEVRLLPFSRAHFQNYRSQWSVSQSYIEGTH